AARAPGSGVADTRELDQLQLVEEARDYVRLVDAMGVEEHARLADRQREQQLATRGEHALQLARRLRRPLRVERVPVAAEPYVLGDVQARDRLKRAVRVRHLEHATGDGRQPGHARVERANVDVGHVGDAGQETGEVDAGGDVHVAGGPPLCDAARRP